MTILEQSPVEPLSGKSPDGTIEPTKRRIRLGMRWKMLAGFGAGFTIVFLVVALVLLNWFTGEADRNLRQTLTGIAVGGAQTIDGDPLPGLIDDVPTRDSIAESLGELYPAGAGLLTGTPPRGLGVQDGQLKAPRASCRCGRVLVWAAATSGSTASGSRPCASTCWRPDPARSHQRSYRYWATSRVRQPSQGRKSWPGRQPA